MFDGNFVLSEFSIEHSDTNRIDLSDATATYEAAGFTAATALDDQHDALNGWAIRGVTGVDQAIYFAVREPICSDGDACVTFVIRQLAGDNQVLGRFRLAATRNPAAIRAPRTAPPPADIADILALAREKRSDEQKQKLAAY